MPNRILRDCTMSDKINQLSVHSERFFYRLMMKADDFGCFHADPRLLKANLFPLLLDTIREADISRWLTELANTKDEQGEKSGMIVLYESGGKKYLQILDFKQRLDRMRSMFPKFDNQATTIYQPTDNPKRETKQETKQEPEEEEVFYRKFSHLKLTFVEFDKLTAEGHTQKEIDYILDAIENYKKNNNYKSLFLTAKKWLEKEKSFAKKENYGNTKTSNLESISRGHDKIKEVAAAVASRERLKQDQSERGDQTDSARGNQ